MSVGQAAGSAAADAAASRPRSGRRGHGRPARREETRLRLRLLSDLSSRFCRGRCPAGRTVAVTAVRPPDRGAGVPMRAASLAFEPPRLHIGDMVQCHMETAVTPRHRGGVSGGPGGPGHAENHCVRRLWRERCRECACACVHVCVCLCACTCVHVCLCAWTCVNMCLCVCARVCVRECACACVHMCARACVCTCARACVSGCMYVHACVHVCACVPSTDGFSREGLPRRGWGRESRGQSGPAWRERVAAAEVPSPGAAQGPLDTTRVPGSPSSNPAELCLFQPPAPTRPSAWTPGRAAVSAGVTGRAGCSPGLGEGHAVLHPGPG